MSIYRELSSHFSLKHRESLVDCFPYRMLKSAVLVHGPWHMEREDGLVSLVSRDILQVRSALREIDAVIQASESVPH